MDTFENKDFNNMAQGSEQEPKAKEAVNAEAASASHNSTRQWENTEFVKAEEKAQPLGAGQPSTSFQTYGQSTTQSAPTQSESGRAGAQPAGNRPVGTPPSYSAAAPGVSWNTGAQAPHAGMGTAPTYGARSYGSTGAVIPPAQPPKPKKKKSKGAKIALGLLAVFIIGIAGGLVGTLISNRISGGSTGNAVIYESDTKTSKETDSTGSAKNTNTVESVASTTAASVVEVKTSYVQTGSFFGNYVTSGAGSGVVISKDGYIVTNNHVIEDAQEITVTLKSGKEYKAKLVGTDDKTDIAVLKIEASDLTPATFGDSSAVAVGEQIVVVGNPLGNLGGSVTTGIISATDREIEIEKMTMTLLQIDAAVNPGNSGGALFNLNGELVGIVNAKYSSEEVEGLGFAIPINTAKATIEDIVEYGYVKGRAQLGITAMEISDLQTAISAGVTELGVYVYNVSEGSGADKAGLKSGDRLVKVDDKEIDSYATLSKILDSHSVGDTVNVTYSRNGSQKTVSIKLIEYKPSNNSKNNSNDSNGMGAN